jgi:hypothetical protein
MNINPILAVAIDLSRRREVIYMTTIIRMIAPHLSVLAARLKKIHHMTTANPQATPPKNPTAAALGASAGRRYLTSHCIITIITPGQNRSGFC